MAAIHWSPDLSRVLALPRRTFALPSAEVVSAVSAAHRHPGTSGSLFPIQALALLEAQMAKGLFAPIRVGGGKTLISGLIPQLFQASRPVLIVPAALVKKTRMDLIHYAKTWKIATHIYVTSYQALGRQSGKSLLETHSPDLIIADEAHRLKNAKAAVTRRVRRYMEAAPQTMFFALSGTLLKRGLGDISHLCKWALKEGSPLPLRGEIADEWSIALGFGSARSGAPIDVGALSSLAGKAPGAPCSADEARRGMQARLVETRGVVATSGASTLAARLCVTVKDFSTSIDEVTRGHLVTLAQTGERPDGKPLMFPPEFWAVRRELAMGFHYAWSPPGPQEWMIARKVWAATVRQILAFSRTLDSESEVIAAVSHDPRHEEIRPVLTEWLAQKPRFKPHSIPRWFSTTTINRCAEWGRANLGLIWVEHAAFGHALARALGTRYYGADGLASDGAYIDEDPATQSIVVGVAANSAGRNLQHKWGKMLFPCPLGAGADAWEQAIGRCYREGQWRPEVNVEVWLLIPEHFGDMAKAVSQASKIYSTTGNTQFLLTADVEGFDVQDIIDMTIDGEI